MDDASDPFGLIGTPIGGRYRADAVVGEGGFGVVYRGTHEGFDAPIAIKCLKLPAHFGPALRETLVRQLREEGRLLLKLSQRTATIVQALDVGTHTTALGARVPFLVLEWLEGRTLAEDLRARRKAGRAPRTIRESYELLTPLARALSVAHAENVAHRDVKPENIMLVGAGDAATVKLLDFGIAKVLDEASSAEDAKTSEGSRAFTAGYAAPEQFDKARGASGPWSDVFALALVFVEVASGSRALSGQDFMDVFRKTIDPDVRPTLAAVGVEASADLERVLTRAVHVDPRVRYADAGRFWDDLGKAVEATPIAAVKPDVAQGDDALLSTREFMDQRSGAKSAESDAKGVTTPRSLLDMGSAATERATTRAPTVSAAVEAPRQRPALLRWAAGGLLAIAVAATSARSYLSRPPTASAGGPPGPASASASPSAPTSSAVSSNPEAATLYAEALEAWRSGTPDAAVASLEKAVALDRALAAGELRLALWTISRKPAAAKEHYDVARLHAPSLGAKDAALLDAARPLMGTPEDPASYEEKLSKLAERYPGDAELWALVSQARLRLFRYEDALAAADKALAIDPSHAASWMFKAEAQADEGNAQGRLDSVDRCLEASPRAAECLLQRANAHSSLGQCDAMLEDAKRYAAISTASARAERVLASALWATHAADEAVLLAFGRSWELLPAKERPRAEARDRARLAILKGDFAGALRFVEAWANEVRDEPDQTSHLEPALFALAIEHETGRDKDAATRATTTRARMSAWSEPSTGDWTLALDRYRLFAHDLAPAEFDAARAAWSKKTLAKWAAATHKEDAEVEWDVWSTAYGEVAIDAPTAEAAVANTPREIARLASGRYSSLDVLIGRAYVLAKQPDKAIPTLHRASRACSFELADPISATVAWYYLGLALEATGDAAGAKSAYAKVVERWAKAEPPSMTAQQASARLAALGGK